MKAVLYPFGPKKPSVQLTKDFQALDWTIGASQIIISTHVAGQGSTGYPQHKRLFAQNLARFLAGEALINECKVPAKASPVEVR